MAIVGYARTAQPESTSAWVRTCRGGDVLTVCQGNALIARATAVAGLSQVPKGTAGMTERPWPSVNVTTIGG
jgi:hypothetical protein